MIKSLLPKKKAHDAWTQDRARDLSGWLTVLSGWLAVSEHLTDDGQGQDEKHGEPGSQCEIIARYSEGKMLRESRGFNRRSYFCEDHWESEYYFDFSLD